MNDNRTNDSRHAGTDEDDMQRHSVEDEGVQDVAPGDEGGVHDFARGVKGYLIGFVLATALTGVAFYIAQSTLVWQPSIPIALTVLAIAQMGVHLVFFLHLTSGADNVNNALALAFGLLIVMLLVFGSLWIMTHLDHRTMPMDEVMKMQR